MLPEPGPRGAEATLGATASPLGQPSGRGRLPEKARSRPKNPPISNTKFCCTTAPISMHIPGLEVAAPALIRARPPGL